METFIGKNKAPKKLYILQDSKGNDINDVPVSRGELIDIILESEVSDAINDAWADSDRNFNFNEEEYLDFRREHAIEEAKECGYRIIEVLRNV